MGGQACASPSDRRPPDRDLRRDRALRDAAGETPSQGGRIDRKGSDRGGPSTGHIHPPARAIRLSAFISERCAAARFAPDRKDPHRMSL